MGERAKAYAAMQSAEDIFSAATDRSLPTWEDNRILDEIYEGSICISGTCSDMPMRNWTYWHYRHHMAQNPMLRGEVGARALRVRLDVRGHGQVRLCKALGCSKCWCLKPIRA